MSKLFQCFECSSYFIFKKINKNYAFEIPGVPAECECLEIRYDVSTYIPISLPYSFMFMPSNIKCDHHCLPLCVDRRLTFFFQFVYFCDLKYPQSPLFWSQLYIIVSHIYIKSFCRDFSSVLPTFVMCFESLQVE